MKKSKESNIKRCKFCGKPIAVIECGLYRKVVVDADVVEVIADANGEEYIRFDGISGGKIKARPTEPLDDMTAVEWAYRPHRWSCR